MSSELTYDIGQFATKAAAAGAGSLLLSFILSARYSDPQLEWGRAVINFGRQVALGAISGLIVAGIPGIEDLPVAFAGGLIFALIWNLILNPIKDQVELERTTRTELRTTLAKAQAAVEQEPEKPKPLWDLSRVQLEIYIRQNQAQVRSIFFITLVVMAAGIGLVCYGVWRAIEGRLDVAILTTVSGVITQGIGTTFLLIYKSTMVQAAGYVAILERINAVGMSVQVVDLIPDGSADLKNKARADLVKQMLSHAKASPARQGA